MDGPIIEHQFTCLCCHVSFASGDMQRLHYKSDWHRFNLKRQICDLPPVTSEEFQRRVLTLKNEQQLSSQDTGTYCKCCRKLFKTAKAFENHLNSKKHKENAELYKEAEISEPIKVEDVESVKDEEMAESDEDEEDDDDDDAEVEEIDSDEWEDDTDVDVNVCLFCCHKSKNLLDNVKHMSEIHTFFIPDVEYCIDITGLIEYLGKKIEGGFMCIWCNEKGKTYYSAEAARRHMLDKGHCKMLHEGEALTEYIDFYDYSSSYPDAEDGHDIDEEIEETMLHPINEFEMELPSGTVIGSRYMMAKPGQDVELVRQQSRKVHKVLKGYRMLGYASSTDIAQRRALARDIHNMKRQQAKLQLKLGMGTNNLGRKRRILLQ